MSETPERIWAFAPDIFDNLSVWQDAPSPAGDTIEYVRADRIEELEAKLAKAVEALDEAMYLVDIDVEDILKITGRYRIVKAYAELGAVIPHEWADALKCVEELTGGKDE